MTAKKSILFTNLTLCARTGSELHILELAKKFKEENWDVTCFTLIAAYPLLKNFQELGIKVIVVNKNEKELSQSYDVLFAQHKCVSEYLLNSHNIRFRSVIVSILGIPSVTPHESLPYFKEEADLILFVSEESKRESGLSKKLKKKAYIFPNYATKEYFLTQRRTFPNFPKRIAVISNHIPKELFEFSDLIKTKQSIVDFFGYQTESVELSPDLLKQYDLIISIGRTAQCCFASKIPFYNYDHFGGPGYCFLKTIKSHEEKNFSGRSEQTKRTALELFNDISNNYSMVIKELQELQDYAKINFSFDLFFDELKDRIDFFLSQNEEKKIAFNSNQIELTENIKICYEFIKDYSKNLGTAEVFFRKNKKDFSLIYKYRYNSLINIDTSQEKLGDDTVIIRFDPDMVPCICKLKTKGNALNSDKTLEKGSHIFITRDPIYLIPKEQSISFSVNALKDPLEALEDKINKLEESLKATTSIRLTFKNLIALIVNRFRNIF